MKKFFVIGGIFAVWYFFLRGKTAEGAGSYKYAPDATIKRLAELNRKATGSPKTVQPTKKTAIVSSGGIGTANGKSSLTNDTEFAS